MIDTLAKPGVSPYPVSSVTAANPQSIMVGFSNPPLGEQTMFPGLMSQCMTPLACTADKVFACGTNKCAKIKYAP
jgi:hypothetical protein